MAKKSDVQLIRSAGKRDKSIAESLTHMVVGVYVFAMMMIFPLFYQDKFYNMGTAKYNFFKYVNSIVLPCIVLMSVVCLVIAVNSGGFKKLIMSISLTDWFVIGYLLVVLVSYLASDYRSGAWWGSSGWYMGLFSQLVFIGIYFVVSRFYEVKKVHIYMLCIVSGIIFLLGVLNRFQIDPLNMYDGQYETNVQIREYLSTMGQPTWYSSFMCTVFPLGLYIFWRSEERRERIAMGIYVLVGFATMVTQNSDSAYIALVFMMLGLFCFSFSSNKKLISFVEVCAIALTAFKLMGLLQMMFPDRIFENDTLSRVLAQSSATLVLWIAVLAVLAFLIVLDRKNKLNAVKFNKLPAIVCGLFVLAIIGVIILVVCVTTGNIPESWNSLKESNYLNFTDHWGNSRGINWKYAIKLVGSSNPVQRLFGCGPDCYEAFLYDHYQIDMDMFWGTTARLSNAHNEWLNMLVTTGVLGFVSYGGIFIARIVSCVKTAAKEPFLIAVVLSVLGYMGHNLFCYQQIVCTPIVFIIMGVGEYIIRESKAENA